MKRNIFSASQQKAFIILFLTVVLNWQAKEGMSSTISYTLSVTIPPHIEIPQRQLRAEVQNKTENFFQPKDQKTTREETLRDNRPIILETTTAK